MQMQIIEQETLIPFGALNELEVETLSKSAAFIKQHLLALKEMQEALNAIMKERVVMKGFVSQLTTICNENAKIGKYGINEEVTPTQVRHFLQQKSLKLDRYKIIPNCVELFERLKNDLSVKFSIYNTQTTNTRNRNDSNTSATNA